MSLLLFSPFTVGALTLPNRIVMAPLTRQRATLDHIPRPMQIQHYADRAEAGLLISEGVAPDPNGAGYLRMPGIWSDAQVAAWRSVTDAVHEAGGRIAVQLMHSGRVSHPANMPPGASVVGPSAIPVGRPMRTLDGHHDCPTPLAMSEAQIETTVEGYVHASENAMRAGFDMVELHGANGYLIDQFISPCSNTRDDKWGGDIEGRGRFPLEVARRCAAAIGSDRVGIRLSPHGQYSGIIPWDTLVDDFTWLAGELGRLGLAYLHLVDHGKMGGAPVPDTTKAVLRDAFAGPIVLCGGYDAETGNADLEAKTGDLIAYGRPFIANPDLVARMRVGAPLNSPDPKTFFTDGEEGYNDYPKMR